MNLIKRDKRNFQKGLIIRDGGSSHFDKINDSFFSIEFCFLD